MKKKTLFKKNTVILFAISALLLGASAVGSARAAITYYSENYVAAINTSNIDVSLLENGAATEKLLENLLAEDEDLTLGKKYEEAISVTNTGEIDEYVRVILTKSWRDADGTKDTNLSPELINLNLTEGSGWVVDEAATTPERMVLYYTQILPAGATAPALSDTFSIDSALGTKVVETVTTDENGKTITYVHEYDGYTAHIDVEADAVQTHNAQDAIKSAWGIDVSVAADGSISLR